MQKVAKSGKSNFSVSLEMFKSNSTYFSRDQQLFSTKQPIIMQLSYNSYQNQKTEISKSSDVVSCMFWIFYHFSPIFTPSSRQNLYSILSVLSMGASGMWKWRLHVNFHIQASFPHFDVLVLLMLAVKLMSMSGLT